MNNRVAWTSVLTTSVAVCHPHQSKVLCVRHPTFHAWMCPGGHLEPGESPHQAAVRELTEEVGLEVQLVDLSTLPLWSAHHNRRLAQPLAVIEEELPDNPHIRLVDFVFAGVSCADVLVLRGEVSAARWVDRETLGSLPVSYPIRQMGYHVLGAIEDIRLRASIVRLRRRPRISR